MVGAVHNTLVVHKCPCARLLWGPPAAVLLVCMGVRQAKHAQSIPASTFIPASQFRSIRVVGFVPSNCTTAVKFANFS